jgi:hypothetical protein
MSGAVIAANQSIKVDSGYNALVNQSTTGAFDSGIITLIAAPANGYLNFRSLPNSAAPVTPTVTFTVSVPGASKETEMQIYVAGSLVFNQPSSGAGVVTHTLDLSSYNEFYLHNGLSIQYRMRGVGNPAATQTVTYPSGKILVLAFSNSP